MQDLYLTPIVQKALLDKYYDIFYVICHALGGVILQTQFRSWISGGTSCRNTAYNRMNQFVEEKLMRVQPFFQNNLLVMSKQALGYFGSNDSCRITTSHIMRSALVMESLLNGRTKVAPSVLVQELDQGAIAWSRRPPALELVNALQRYIEQIEKDYPEWDTTSLRAEYQRIGVRSYHAIMQLSHNVDKPLPLDTTIPDLFTLERNNVFLRRIEVQPGNDSLTLHAYLNLYDITNLSTKKKILSIIKALFTCETAFYSLNPKHHVVVHIDIYSHYPADAAAEKRLRKHLSQSLALHHIHDDELAWLTVHCLDTSKRFFSGIPLDRLK